VGLYRSNSTGLGATRRVQLGAVIGQRLPDRHAALSGLLCPVEGSANWYGVLPGARFVMVSALLLDAVSSSGGLAGWRRAIPLPISASLPTMQVMPHHTGCRQPLISA